MDPGQIEDPGNRADEMVVRDRRIEIKRVEKLPLVLIAPTHHGSPPQTLTLQQRNHCSPQPTTPFCNKIGQVRTSLQD